MKKIRTYLLMLCALCIFGAQAQNIGRPERKNPGNLLKNFQRPPLGYGEVPFYWWMGDTLTREHLLGHLEILKNKGISSLQVNYAHSDKGGKSWGLTFKSKPEIFTEEWWDLFGWFMKEANKRGMTVSLSDYTLGVGQEQFVDEALAEHPEITGHELRMEKLYAQGQVDWKLAENPLSIVAYKMNADSTLLENSATDLIGKVKNKRLEWNSPEGTWAIVHVYTIKKDPSYDPMHPLSGKTYVKHFFQKFEDRFPEDSKNGLNFFFSDELNFQLGNLIWNEYFQQEFIKRKGYDIVPHLAALYEDLGDLTPKYRLDYNDVMVSLSEENFFKPVYDWHEERGLIYGCDHGGRGLDVTEFGDYFRTQKWNQGPGCDQSHLQKNVIKNKVASSIAHMYERPRTWLEGFYGSGWNTSSAMLADAIFTNFVQGQNLLSLHGLYYSTPGGWWEWAPPCNHFRMPYWEDMDKLLACTERLSYLLSQGYHRADVALLYPVEPVIAGNGKGAVNCAFETGRALYADGIDFDFMDYQSLARAEVKGNELHVSGERFKVLIIPAMQTIQSKSLQKAIEFKKAGGLVICIDIRPDATETGRNDVNIQTLASQLSITPKAEVIKQIRAKIVPDFFVENAKNPNVMHRKIGKLDVYAIYNIKKGSNCFFRAKGGVSLWNPWNGQSQELKVLKTDENGTYLSAPLNETDVQIFVFDPDKTAETGATPAQKLTRSILVEGEWNVQVIPTLDNRWGDYHWPASNNLLGAEIRAVNYSNQANADIKQIVWNKQSVGYGAVFKWMKALAKPLTKEELLTNNELPWEDYDFSWRWGVEGDYGHQGYHGLKTEMYDDFIRMGKIEDVFTELRRVEDPAGKHYYFSTSVIANKSGNYKILSGTKKPVEAYLNGKALDIHAGNAFLNKGENQLILHYEGAGTTYFLFKDKELQDTFDKEVLKERPISMKWNGDLSVLPMTPYPDCQKMLYEIKTAPSANQLTFAAYAENIKVWTADKKLKCKKGVTRADLASSFEIDLGENNPYGTTVYMEIEPAIAGRNGGAMFPYPIQQTCGSGIMTLGDWGEKPGLEYFSGGMEYTKEIEIPNLQTNEKCYLNLGDVCSSASIWINEKEVATRLIGPWVFDISEYVRTGKNQIKVIVYNTAYNHYLSIPTMYRKKQSSGILGPVSIDFMN